MGKNRPNNRKLIKKYIELCEAQRSLKYGSEKWYNIKNEMGVIMSHLLPQQYICHYNYKLSHKKIIGPIYRIYYKIFKHTWKSGGPISIIGKWDEKKQICTYPNIPYYRITKAWKWI